LDDGTGLKYFLTDHLGSVVAVTDAGGSLLSQQRYLPFGGVRTDVGTITQTDFGYTFQRNLDAQPGYDLGLMDYRARFYSPSILRWTQPDPFVPEVGGQQAYNRYTYALNSPQNYIDPSGHNPKCGPGGMFCDYDYDPRNGSGFFYLGDPIPPAPDIHVFYPPLDPSVVDGGFNYQDPFKPSHEAVDVAGDEGDPVQASGVGIVHVSEACWLEDCEGQWENTGAPVNGGYGNVLIVEYNYNWLPQSVKDDLGQNIDEGQSVFILYAHLQEKSPLEPYDSVSPQDLLGHVGNTGFSDGAHLHVETKIGDPSDFGYGLLVADPYTLPMAYEPFFQDYCLWSAWWNNLTPVDPHLLFPIEDK
jgi:RHS repeat-associated protein